MCRFTIEGDGQGRSFVVPLSQLSLGQDNQFQMRSRASLE